MSSNLTGRTRGAPCVATVTGMSAVDIVPFEDHHADGIARLSTTVQWPSLTDPETVRAVCTAPGASAYVALADGLVVGWAQALGDGRLQSHLSFVAVHPDHRRRGIARLLTVATFQATHTLRMDPDHRLGRDVLRGVRAPADARVPDLPGRLSLRGR